MVWTLGIFLFLSQFPEDPPPPPLPSQAIPGTTLLNPLSGDPPLAFSQVAGKRGTVFVWISLDCPMARGYLPKLNRLAKQFAPLGVPLVGIFAHEKRNTASNTPQSTSIQLKDAVKPWDIAFPLFVDESGQWQKLLDARVTPESFVLNGDGKVVYRGRIDDGFSARLESRGRIDREDLTLAIESLTQGKPIALSATRAYGCPLPRQGKPAPPSPGAPTFHQTIGPLLQEHCQSCHQPGGLAPFSLMTFDDAVRWAEDIRDFTHARRMPPWLPTQSVPLRDSRSMTQESISLIARWVEAGCPEGHQSAQPIVQKNKPSPEEWKLGPPDLILDAGEDLVVGAEGPDLFRCLILPTGLTEGRYVTAYEVKPGNQAVVHHMVNFLDNKGRARRLQERFKEPKGSLDRGPGYNSTMGPGFLPPTGDLGGWAPGSAPHRLSPGVGYWLPANTDIVMQIHYHRTGKVERDRSKLGIYFAKPEDAVNQPFQVIPVGAPFLSIPPRQSAAPVSGKLWITEDCTLHMLMPHMHLLGKSIKLTVTRPGQPQETLLDIARWDYNWQEHYFLEKPMKLPKGTRLGVEAVYDNSASNPKNPFSPPRTILVGEGTHNEMCFGFFGLTRDSGGPVGLSLSPGGFTIRRLGELPR